MVTRESFTFLDGLLEITVTHKSKPLANCNSKPNIVEKQTLVSGIILHLEI